MSSELLFPTPFCGRGKSFFDTFFWNPLPLPVPGVGIPRLADFLPPLPGAPRPPWYNPGSSPCHIMSSGFICSQSPRNCEQSPSNRKVQMTLVIKRFCAHIGNVQDTIIMGKCYQRTLAKRMAFVSHSNLNIFISVPMILITESRYQVMFSRNLTQFSRIIVDVKNCYQNVRPTFGKKMEWNTNWNVLMGRTLVAMETPISNDHNSVNIKLALFATR